MHLRRQTQGGRFKLASGLVTLLGSLASPVVRRAINMPKAATNPAPTPGSCTGREVVGSTRVKLGSCVWAARERRRVQKADPGGAGCMAAERSAFSPKNPQGPLPGPCRRCSVSRAGSASAGSNGELASVH